MPQDPAPSPPPPPPPPAEASSSSSSSSEVARAGGIRSRGLGGEGRAGARADQTQNSCKEEDKGE